MLLTFSLSIELHFITKMMETKVSDETIAIPASPFQPFDLKVDCVSPRLSNCGVDILSMDKGIEVEQPYTNSTQYRTFYSTT